MLLSSQILLHSLTHLQLRCIEHNGVLSKVISLSATSKACCNGCVIVVCSQYSSVGYFHIHFGRLPATRISRGLLSYLLKYSFGTQYLPQINSSTKDTLALLNLLALDLPNDVVCSPCRRLHKMENLPRYNSETYIAGRTIGQYHSLRLE